MFRFAIIVSSLISSSSVFADVDADFQKAVNTEGPEYVAAREQLVATAGDEFLKNKSGSADIREKVVAQAVLGWKANGKLYKERTTSETYVSKGEFVLFEWVKDPNALRAPEMLPLALEMLLKNSAGEPGRLAAMRIISAAAGKKKFADLDALFAYLSAMPGQGAKAAATIPGQPVDRRSEDVQRRVDPAVIVAQTIAGLPVDQVPTKRVIETLHKIGEYPDKVRMRAIASALANAFLRVEPRMSPQEKVDLMAILTSEKELLGAVGPEVTLRIAGTIGGPKAVAALVKYLREGKDATEEKGAEDRAWAFVILRRMRDGLGEVPLQEYARDTKMPAKGRVIALENLAGLKYSEEIGETLKSVLEDNSAPTVVRFEALRSFDQLLRGNQNRPEITGPIRTAIAETSFEPDEASGYQGAAQQIKDFARASK